MLVAQLIFSIHLSKMFPLFFLDFLALVSKIAVLAFRLFLLLSFFLTVLEVKRLGVVVLLGALRCLLVVQTSLVALPALVVMAKLVGPEIVQLAVCSFHMLKHYDSAGFRML